MYGYKQTSPPVSPPASPTPSFTGSTYSTNGQLQRRDSRKDARLTASAKRNKYMRRLVYFKQMDFQYALWQMIYLFMAPQKVYRNFAYRKETKHQWARDDPAFLVLLSICLCVSSVGFTLALRLGFVGFIKFILWVVFVDCIGVGLVIATLLWWLTNKYLVIMPPRGLDVEWGYAFDVHLNAFFPLLMILHFFQLPLLHAVILQDWFIGRFLGNTLWLLAIAYYLYITFLGYSSLPFLKKTQVFLYPVTILAVIYFISLLAGPNLSLYMCYFYEYRVAH